MNDILQSSIDFNKFMTNIFGWNYGWHGSIRFCIYVCVYIFGYLNLFWNGKSIGRLNQVCENNLINFLFGSILFYHFLIKQNVSYPLYFTFFLLPNKAKYTGDFFAIFLLFYFINSTVFPPKIKRLMYILIF